MKLRELPTTITMTIETSAPDIVGMVRREARYRAEQRRLKMAVDLLISLAHAADAHDGETPEEGGP